MLLIKQDSQKWTICITILSNLFILLFDFLHTLKWSFRGNRFNRLRITDDNPFFLSVEGSPILYILIFYNIIDSVHIESMQRRHFWCVRTWPYKSKFWAFSVIKPVLFQGLIPQKRTIVVRHSLLSYVYYLKTVTVTIISNTKISKLSGSTFCPPPSLYKLIFFRNLF